MREQNREELAAEAASFSIIDTSEIPEAVRIEEMADWFRSLYIPSGDARVYIERFIEAGYDSLESLGQICDEEICKVKCVLKSMHSISPGCDQDWPPKHDAKPHGCHQKTFKFFQRGLRVVVGRGNGGLGGRGPGS